VPPLPASVARGRGNAARLGPMPQELLSLSCRHPTNQVSILLAKF